jgi:hypothetical protein
MLATLSTFPARSVSDLALFAYGNIPSFWKVMRYQLFYWCLGGLPGKGTLSSFRAGSVGWSSPGESCSAPGRRRSRSPCTEGPAIAGQTVHGEVTSCRRGAC